MSISAYIKLVLAVILVTLGYFTYTLFEKTVLLKEQLKKATADLLVVNEAKQRAEAAQADLTTKLNTEQAKTAKVITKLVKVPVVVEEKCMSPVLKEALKDD